MDMIKNDGSILYFKASVISEMATCLKNTMGVARFVLWGKPQGSGGTASKFGRQMEKEKILGGKWKMLVKHPKIDLFAIFMLKFSNKF